MTEIRCVKCRRLLMKAETAKAEVKCPKCGYLNHLIIFFVTEPKGNFSNGAPFTPASGEVVIEVS